MSPISRFVPAAREIGRTFWDHPSLLWFFPSESALTLTLALGLLASTMLAFGIVPRISLFLSWVSYLSIVRVGWPFMNFQWDTLLLEASFTSLFIVPLCLWDRPRTHAEPHPFARWALWWLLGRLVFRSAWVKLASGDPSWADLTALTYHYWTQPLPTVFAWFAHQLPVWVHRLSCAVMFAIEFIAPVLMFVPRVRFRRAASLLVGGLMVLIILTGNYGFFNLLTLALCLTLLDDALFRRSPEPVDAPPRSWVSAVGPALVIFVSSLVFIPSLFGANIETLKAIDGFDTFNNYGLFSVMTKTRPEIVIEGSFDGEHWEAYEFRYKPGSLSRAPVWNTPHQPRLDWQMWFAALGDHRRNLWLRDFMHRLMNQEPSVVDLIEKDPFESQPNHMRAVVYEYEFTTWEERQGTGNWWKRQEKGLYAPVLHRREAE